MQRKAWTTKRVLKNLLAVWLIVLLVSVVLAPLQRHAVSEEVKTAVAQQMDSPTSKAQERVLAIDDNNEALVWRLRLIEQAQHRIILSTYDFENDESGQDIMAALQNAAQRGVQVQILLDGVNGFLRWYGGAPLRALASQPNVELKLYNPINLFLPWRLNYRLHDKYLIVDDEVFLLGGRNIGDLFLGNYIPEDKKNVDRDLLIWKPDSSVPGTQQELAAYFDKVWNLPTNQTKARPGRAAQKESEKLAARYDTLKQKYPEIFDEIDFEAETLPANEIRLLTGSCKVENKAPELWYALQQQMLQGEDVIIQTPYIICDRAMYQDLENLCKDGRRVRIITNAVENGANPFGCTDYLNNREKILKTGAAVYEHTSIFSIHAKTILVDDRWSMVGSYNLDMRSTYLNSEIMLAVDSPELNEQLRQEFEVQAQESLQVMPDGTQTAGENYAPAPMGLFKKLLYALLRLITLPIRQLL